MTKSPDGRRVAYLQYEDHEETHLSVRVANINGTNRRYLFRPSLLIYPPFMFRAWDIVWSPDGSRVAFVQDDGGDADATYLLTVSSKGSDVSAGEDLDPGERVSGPSSVIHVERWGADGFLYFVGYRTVDGVSGNYRGKVPAHGGEVIVIEPAP